MRHDDDADNTKALEDLLDLPPTNPNPSGEYELVEFATLREMPERPSRHTVSLAAVLSPEEVIHLIGGRASVARRWLRRVRPLAHPTGRRVYVWGDVLAAMREVA